MLLTFRPYLVGMIHTPGIVGQIPPAMPHYDFEVGVALKYPAENKARYEHCLFQGLADNVVEIIVFHSRGVGKAHRMNKDQHIQLLHLSPKRFKAVIVQVRSSHIVLYLYSMKT